MADNGYLDGSQMAGSFALLNARDLIWARRVNANPMGRSEPTSDLAAWNADTTPMPYRQHSEYLHQLYLDNDLALGRYPVDGKPVVLSDIGLPLFALGTLRDTVVPWHSAIKAQRLAVPRYPKLDQT